MKHIKLFEGFGKFDEDNDESVQLSINKAKEKFNSSTEDWFDSTLHNVPTEMTRVEASLILRGLKEDGYKIIKK
jgi:hypothetical protein